MLLDDTTKQCGVCGRLYPNTTEWFFRRGDAADGLQKACKACARERVVRSRNKKLEYYTHAAKEYRDNNKDKERARGSIYRKSHPEVGRKKVARWRASNPDKNREIDKRRRARKKSLPCSLTWQEWEGILADYEYSCAYCGKKWYQIVGKLTQDHVIPISRGGGHTKDNVVPACGSCNCTKHDKTPEEWGVPVRKP